MKIFDFVVGRKTLRWGRSQDDFFNVLLQSAIEAIEETYGDHIDPQSIKVMEENEFKYPPHSPEASPSHLHTTNSSSQYASSHSPVPPMIPFVQRKIQNLSSCTTIPMLSHPTLHISDPTTACNWRESPSIQGWAGLTKAQKSILLDLLRDSIRTADPFAFMQLVITATSSSTLKMKVPRTVLRQNERFISISLQWPIPAHLTKWELLELEASTPFSCETGDQVELKQVEDPTKSDQFASALQVFGVDENLVEYAIYLELASEVKIERSYATLSREEERMEIVCEKVEIGSVWPSIIKLDNRSNE
jgi:hypothetical protein